MGADLFESYVGSILGAMILGLGISQMAGAPEGASMYVLMPLYLAGIGIIASAGNVLREDQKAETHKRHFILEHLSLQL